MGLFRRGGDNHHRTIAVDQGWGLWMVVGGERIIGKSWREVWETKLGGDDYNLAESKG